jgi:hypothetical protein
VTDVHAPQHVARRLMRPGVMQGVPASGERRPPAACGCGARDTPPIRLRYRCSNCAGGSQFTDWVVSNGYNPQPWR